MEAAGNGRKETVDILIQNGANVNAKTDSDDTALHFAAFRGIGRR